MTTPFIAIGNDELGEEIGAKAKCPNCGKKHPVEYGTTKNAQGETVKSKILGFVRCGEESYLVAVDGKSLTL